MEMVFESRYSVGDRVKIRKGEHNDNWAGKVGKIVEIGVDLHVAAYIVKFKNEIYMPCFLRNDLKPVQRKNNLDNKMIFNTKFNIGDKVKTLPNVKSMKSALYLNGEAYDVYIDNHLSLEQIIFAYENKLGWCSPDKYQWFNNMIAYLNATEDKDFFGQVGEIIEISVDGTEKSHTIIYTVKYSNEGSLPCFRENDLELIK